MEMTRLAPPMCSHALGTRSASQSARRVLRVCALYPDLMNIYADRGNLMVLERRCAWRGIGFQLSASGLREPLDGSAHDLFYMGGGQDRDQRLCAEDLVEHKRDGLHEAAHRGAVVLGVCGGYQLLGRHYEVPVAVQPAAHVSSGEPSSAPAGQSERLPGVGLLAIETMSSPGPRLIGNVAIEVRMDGSDGGNGPTRVLAGFENHGGRTYLDQGQAPLGRVLKGYGNDGCGQYEGARFRNVIGTYLHGPLLPKNAWLADWLIATALELDPDTLDPLDASFEQAAHESARRAAGLRASA